MILITTMSPHLDPRNPLDMKKHGSHYPRTRRGASVFTCTYIFMCVWGGGARNLTFVPPNCRLITGEKVSEKSTYV